MVTSCQNKDDSDLIHINSNSILKTLLSSPLDLACLQQARTDHRQAKLNGLQHRDHRTDLKKQPTTTYRPQARQRLMRGAREGTKFPIELDLRLGAEPPHQDHTECIGGH